MTKGFLDFLYEAIVATRGSLGIARKDMPQIKGKDIPNFLKKIQQKKIRISKLHMSLNQIKPTQKELNTDKIKEKSKLADIHPFPFIISKDKYLLDGHHRWMAMKLENPHQVVEVYMVNLPIRELLGFARAYDRTFYKSIN